MTGEDETGKPDMIMSKVNEDSIRKFQDLLLSTGNAREVGNTFLIDEYEAANRRNWLYKSVKQTVD
jgi:hypothetical protein